MEGSNFRDSGSPKTQAPWAEKFGGNLRRKTLVGAMALVGLAIYKHHPEVRGYDAAVSFNEAFKDSRQRGDKEFRWHGTRYTTKLVDKELSDLYWESKKFLEDYYKSDYFKSKYQHIPNILDSIAAEVLTSERLEMNPRYKYLYERMQARKITSQELEEYLKLLDKESAALMGKSNSALYKKILDSIVASNPTAKAYTDKRIKNLEAPGYFSMTNQKGSEGSDGFYNMNAKGSELFIHGGNPSNHQTVAAHELTHKATRNGYGMEPHQFLELERLALQSIADNNLLVFYMSKGLNLEQAAGWVNYITDPTEIDARANATRFWLFKHFSGYQAGSSFQSEHYDFLLKNKDHVPYDINQLLELFPDKKLFIDIMNKF